MKTALAIVCSLLVLWTQADGVAQPTSAAADLVAGACCGCKAHCCAAPSSPEPQSSPAAPVQSTLQSHLPILATAALAWTLPGAEAAQLSNFSSSPLTAAGVPLFTRNCALLL